MSADERLRKGRDILAVVRQGMIRCIALEALWTRCATKRDILDTMHESRESWGFGVVREAIHRDLVVTLLTIVEHGQNRNASIPALVEIVHDRQVVKLVKKMASRPEQIDACIDRVDAGLDQLKRDGMLKSMRKLRDKVIAHAEFGTVDHGAKYGHPRTVLNKLTPIFEDLSTAIGEHSVPLEKERRAWARNADTFWGHVARPQAPIDLEGPFSG